MPIIKSCGICNKPYSVKPVDIRKNRHHTCSKKCGSIWYKKHHPTRKERIAALCGYCKKTMMLTPRELCKKKFCSVVCRVENTKKKLFISCAICEKIFLTNPSLLGIRKFCSLACLYKHREHAFVGEKSHLWRGGKTEKSKKIRNSAKYKAWRKKVFERDNYTCQICHKRGGELNADHIKQLAYYPELAFELSNGRTLCRPCHKKTETYAYKGARLVSKKQ